MPETHQGPKDLSGFCRNPSVLIAAGAEEAPTSEEELWVAQGGSVAVSGAHFGLSLSPCRLRCLHHPGAADELPFVCWCQTQGPAQTSPGHLLRSVRPVPSCCSSCSARGSLPYSFTSQGFNPGSGVPHPLHSALCVFLVVLENFIPFPCTFPTPHIEILVVHPGSEGRRAGSGCALVLSPRMSHKYKYK